MARKIVVTSGKGGGGENHRCRQSRRAAFAARGACVILCDTDFGLNNMDVVTGVENLVVYDIVDVIEGRLPGQTARSSGTPISEISIFLPAIIPRPNATFPRRR